MSCQSSSVLIIDLTLVFKMFCLIAENHKVGNLLIKTWLTEVNNTLNILNNVLNSLLSVLYKNYHLPKHLEKKGI